MSDVRPRYVPIPIAFPELNVRTYVKTPRRPGVWFFSLDAASWLAVRAARHLGLPYYDANIKIELSENWVHYTSVREHRRTPPADLSASYRPTGSYFYAARGTLERWLTERYCLYGAVNANRIVYGEIHHPQWRLQPAIIETRKNTMVDALGIGLSRNNPLCHFSQYQEVVAWPIVPLERATIRD